jgi:hypothetical protein
MHILLHKLSVARKRKKEKKRKECSSLPIPIPGIEHYILSQFYPHLTPLEVHFSKLHLNIIVLALLIVYF